MGLRRNASPDADRDGVAPRPKEARANRAKREIPREIFRYLSYREHQCGRKLIQGGEDYSADRLLRKCCLFLAKVNRSFWRRGFPDYEIGFSCCGTGSFGRFDFVVFSSLSNLRS